MSTLSLQVATHMHKQETGGPNPRLLCDFPCLETHWKNTKKLPCSFLHSTEGGTENSIPACGGLTADCQDWSVRNPSKGQICHGRQRKRRRGLFIFHTGRLFTEEFFFFKTFPLPVYLQAISSTTLQNIHREKTDFLILTLFPTFSR